MPALGRLIRGLSCIFWGIPLALVASVQLARAEGVRPAQLWFSLAGFALLLLGSHWLSAFQRQERIWQSAVDRARLVAFVNFSLAPFVYWWSRFPSEKAFQTVVDLLVVLVLLFLLQLNGVLSRLAAMLPDEALRQETRVFARIGQILLTPILVITVTYFFLLRMVSEIPMLMPLFAFMSEGGLWFVLFVALLPVALSMAITWKIKELVFHSVFGG